MILHLLNETLFNSHIINQIEDCFPNENIYLIFCEDQQEKISQSYHDKVFYQEEIAKINFDKIDGIIVHYLTIKKARFIVSLKFKIPIGCSLWGSDFYNFLPELKRNLYGDLTKHYLRNMQKNPGFYYMLKDNLFFPISRNYLLWKNVTKKSKIFSTVIPYEKNQVEKYFSSKSEYLQIPTYSLEKVVNTNNFEKTIYTKENYLKNILIGNSGNLTNNHLEILDYIKSLNDEGVRVHVPLTYGNKNYISHICQTGSRLFEKNFHPIIDHLSNSDYLYFLNSINIAIINSYRQQGIGTIIQVLWSGGKAFLSNKNITSTFYNDIGLKIFSIEDDLFKKNNANFFKPLKREEILSNRKILLKLYSSKVVNHSIKVFISNLKGTYINNSDIYAI